MSDEFEMENRTFADGEDPAWTSMDKHDDIMDSAGYGSLHFYNSSQVTTKGGYLNVTAKIGKTTWLDQSLNKTIYQDSRNYISGMVQGWNKFCFTGGIVEVDVIFPGKPNIGGLWPAIWILGNLGRATYEASTNRIWPWSYNTCDRDLQPAQELSACNVDGHYGLNAKQGRGSTEIDIVEAMMGPPGALSGTTPPIANPYAAMTLQSAPGVTSRRPKAGHPPRFNATSGRDGYPVEPPQNWYRHLQYSGNTSINPYFYGTYLAPTLPKEPVQRSAKQAYQADAISAMFQLLPQHFQKKHKFRLEWQPGPGGRIDWYGQMPTASGDVEWVHAYSITDKDIEGTTGAVIPAEPSYLIFNLALSSNWGFPYTSSATCKKCFDCDDPACACSMNRGFCDMLRRGDASMLVESVRVYQSPNAEAHSGANHTLGCDPPEFPTREFIAGHEYRYVRRWPAFDDRHPLKQVAVGGGTCATDHDCGYTRGNCSQGGRRGIFSVIGLRKRCICNQGYVGSHCLTEAKGDEKKGAYEMRHDHSIMERVAWPSVPWPLSAAFTGLVVFFGFSMFKQIKQRKTNGSLSGMRRPTFRATGEDSERVTLITGRSV